MLRSRGLGQRRVSYRRCDRVLFRSDKALLPCRCRRHRWGRSALGILGRRSRAGYPLDIIERDGFRIFVDVLLQFVLTRENRAVDAFCMFTVLGNDESHKDWGKMRTLLAELEGAAKSLWLALMQNWHKGTFTCGPGIGVQVAHRPTLPRRTPLSTLEMGRSEKTPKLRTMMPGTVIVPTIDVFGSFCIGWTSWDSGATGLDGQDGRRH